MIEQYYDDENVPNYEHQKLERLEFRNEVPVMKDYRYIPSKYGTLGLTPDEYDQMDDWAADLYKPNQVDASAQFIYQKPATDHEANTKVMLELGDDQHILKLERFMEKMTLEDKTCLRQQYEQRNGYMLALFAMVADRIYEKGMKVYYELWTPGYDPAKSSLRNEERSWEDYDYDSEGEPVIEDPYRILLRVQKQHVSVFYFYYSAGCHEGIAKQIVHSLFNRMNMDYDYKPWMETQRIEIPHKMGADSGQAKIFLSSLYAFNLLPVQRITILVIGSASHPVLSGYTYHGLARFLTLAGYNGVIHLFDPLEQHLNVEIGNFELTYFKFPFIFGSVYKMEGNFPTVILDDTYGEKGENLSELDPQNSLILMHPTSRVATKHAPGVKSVKGVESSVISQFMYAGDERRIYYRCPRWNYLPNNYVGENCSQCMYFANCILRIGNPPQELNAYWLIYFSIAGVHCQPKPGIRNLMLLNMLRHEIQKGKTGYQARENVMTYDPRGFVKSNVIANLHEFGQKCDLQLVPRKVETHYVPNHDLTMAIRDTVDVPNLVRHLLVPDLCFRIYGAKGYNQNRLSLIRELYATQLDHQGIETDIVLYKESPLGILDPVVYLEYIDNFDLTDYEILYQEGCQAIAVSTHFESMLRMCFDRGKIDDEYADLDL
jgi:hypothetical protein